MARSARQHQDKKRQEKLEAIQKQIDDGSLVIRKMTAKERAESPPRPRKAKKKT
jgi:hypothetical protein